MASDLQRHLDLPLSNAELVEFTHLIDLNQDRDASRLNPKDWKRLSDLRERLLAFLWLAASQLTNDLEIARHGCLGARDMFFEYVGLNGSHNRLKKAVRERLIFRLQTRRTWLLRKLRERVEQAAKGWRSQSTWPLPLDSLTIQSPPSRMLVELRNQCQLRAHRRSPKLCQQGHCLQLCDLLFYEATLDLTLKEIGLTLQIPKSSAAARLYDCQGSAVELQAAQILTKSKF